LLLLSLTIFSSKLTALLLSGNKIILSIAGCFALFALLEDRTVKAPAFVGPPPMPPRNKPSNGNAPRKRPGQSKKP